MSFSTIRNLVAVAVLGCASLYAQTTQGLISGRLLNSVTGRGIGTASIVAIGAGTSEARTTSDASGYFYLPLLSPASYRVQVTQTGYQSQEIQELTLAVAARLELDFLLRPLSDVWEAGQYNSVFLPGSKTIVTFFGPDVDPSRSGSFEAQKGRAGALESTISYVIDSPQIEGLPLLGRDVYTALVTEPGVTSDSATGRGLGLSVNGQRPSASNFLMDGLENNNYLITGPLVTVAPEAVQEYRISTNNFSAEYGRASGFLANTITRSGTNQFHGTGYFYLENDILNANGFQENRQGIARLPRKQVQPGFVLGGPILKNRLFFSSSYEFLRSHSFSDPQPYRLPNSSVLLSALAVTPDRTAYQLLSKYAPVVVGGPAVVNSVLLSVPAALERHLGVERLDHSSPDGKNRYMARLLLQRVTEPDFIWVPYPDFVSPLHQNTDAVGGSYLRLIRPDLTNEARVSISNDHLDWNRPHSEIPTLASADGVTLPGSPAFYAYKNANSSQELLDNLIWTRGRHLVTAGVGVLFRASDGYLTAGRDGEYIYDSVIQFAQERPSSFRVALQRTGVPAFIVPNSNRSYSYRQYFGFAQDTFRMTRRLTVNYGLRYEVFGAPSNTGAVKDAAIQLGSGPTLAQQLVGASLSVPSGGNQQLFGTDKGDVGVRVGASFDLTGNARTLLRGAFGTFYDRPFDNLWENLRNNDMILPSFNFIPQHPASQPAPPPPQRSALIPIPTVLASLAGMVALNDFPEATMVNQDLKNGRIYSYFAGVQHRFSDSLTTEVNAAGSYGRRLITTDIINRNFTVPQGTYVPGSKRYTGVVPNVDYRNSDGISDYNALTALVRYRGARGFLQASYTWSHTIDEQSDALSGDFFNLNFTKIGGGGSTSGRAAFARQFDPHADRGNADFDQRHNFLAQGYWNPAPLFSGTKARWLLRDWNLGALLAIRSGFPYSLLGETRTDIDPNVGGGLIISNRPNLIDPVHAQKYEPNPSAGGVNLLNAAAFTNAAISTLGNVGRNAFTGPGFYNLDLAVGRSFPLPWLGEGARLNFRADAFNMLNHANLGNPDTLLTTPTFGLALFGRQASKGNGFPTLTPLNETPRQIQLSVRVQF